MLVSFDINAEPIPQARPRFSKFGHAYIDKRSRDYRKIVQIAAVQAMQGKKRFDKDIPVSASIIFYRKKKPTAKSDLDNLVKAVLDSCNCSYILICFRSVYYSIHIFFAGYA